MKLNTSFKKFKQLHKKKYSQAVHLSYKCNNYAFIENLYKFILVQKNSNNVYIENYGSSNSLAGNEDAMIYKYHIYQ